MYELQVLSADDGATVPIPSGTQQYTIIDETDEEGRVQVAVLVEKEPTRGVA